MLQHYQEMKEVRRQIVKRMASRNKQKNPLNCDKGENSESEYDISIMNGIKGLGVIKS